MTVVTLAYTKSGVLTSCDATGHAGAGRRGRDVACAAVTVLLRTSMMILDSTKGVALKTVTSGRGELHFEVEIDKGSATAETMARLECAADFVECGVQSVMLEYPQNVRLERRIEGE